MSSLPTTEWRHAIRGLSRNPGFSAVALLSLALAIGANTAIFAVVNAVLLRPLPVLEPDTLVVIQEQLPKFSGGPAQVSAPDFVAFARQNRTLDGVGAFENIPFDVQNAAGAQRITAARVTPGLFEQLGLKPLRGRLFTAAEDEARAPVVVLSSSYWQQRYGADPAVLGQSISLNLQPYTIIGIMAPDVVFPFDGLADAKPAALWTPMSFTSQELHDRGNNYRLKTIGRLKAGMTGAQAKADLDVIAAQLSRQLSNDPADTISTRVTPLAEQVVSRVRLLLVIFLAAVGLVLLIACANVANLVMARATGAHREVAIRTALGASRFDLFTRFLAESLILTVGGAAVGILLAHWGAQAFIRLIPAGLPRSSEVGIDRGVLLFAIGLSIGTALFFSTISLLVSSRSDLSATLKASAKGLGATTSARRFRHALVVAEIALALALLTSAGLLAKSFLRVRAVDPGFRPAHVTSVTLELPLALYTDPAHITAFHKELARRLQSLPDVERVSVSTSLPMASPNDRVFTPEGSVLAQNAALPRCSTIWTLGPYFETLGVTLLKGRFLSARDTSASTNVVVISQRIAARYWPGQDPIGKRLKYGPPQFERPWLTVVGVVGDVKQGPLDADTLPVLYQPYEQAEAARIVTVGRIASFALKTNGDPAALTPAIRKTVADLDSQLAIIQLGPMDDVVWRSIATRRFNMLLIGLFAATALVLASIGIYGVVAYSVTQRTREIGVRMALGASRAQIFSLFIRHGLSLGLSGLLLGLVGVAATGRLFRTLLFGVSPLDAATLAVVAVATMGVVLLAVLVPARRAMSVDPLVALRNE
jgi:predicted permease